MAPGLTDHDRPGPAVRDLSPEARRKEALKHKAGLTAHVTEAVGPGRTLLTVTSVPTSVSARPRAMASCAVLVMP